MFPVTEGPITECLLYYCALFEYLFRYSKARYSDPRSIPLFPKLVLTDFFILFAETRQHPGDGRGLRAWSSQDC